MIMIFSFVTVFLYEVVTTDQEHWGFIGETSFHAKVSVSGLGKFDYPDAW